MNKWLLFQNSINDLVEPNQSQKVIKEKWALIVNNYKDYKPFHLLSIMNLLEQSREGLTSKILDHGCGAGHALFMLASKGYTNIWGIDTNQTEGFIIRKKACNRIFKVILNTKSDRISNYDANKINFKNNTFDYLFS